MRLRDISTMVLAIVAPGCRTTRPDHVAMTPLPLNYTDPVSVAQTYALREGRDSVGSLEFRVQATENAVVNTMFGTYGSRSQRILVTFDPHTLRVRSVRDSAEDIGVDLNYAGSRLQGVIRYRNRLGRFNTVSLHDPIDSMIVDRRSVLVLAPLLPLESGRVFIQRVYDSSTFSVYPVRIAIGRRELVTVPAGTFDAYRLDLTAALPTVLCPGDVFAFPTVLWVRADSSRRIVRIERPHLRRVYDLTSQD